MANPFGGSDEALSKNTGHTNQESLVYALIPRSTSKVYEVITAQECSYLEDAFGTYDSDGYLYGSNLNSQAAASLGGLSINIGSSWTVICAFKYGAGSGSANPQVRITDVSTYTKKLRTALSNNDVGWGTEYSDGSNTWYGSSGSFGGGTHVGISTTTTAGTQTGRYLVSTTDVLSGTGITITGSSYTFSGTATNLQVFMNSGRGFRYLFVYNTVLSTAHQDAIMADPGAVLSYGSTAAGVPKSTKSLLLGVG